LRQAAETKDFNVARAAGGVVLSGANEDMLAVAAAAASSPVSRSVAASRMAPGSPSSTGSVVKGRSAIAQQVKIADVQSPKWAVILQQMQRKNGGKVIAPANRFFFNLDKLDGEARTRSGIIRALLEFLISSILCIFYLLVQFNPYSELY
jgi:hypothetical protein